MPYDYLKKHKISFKDVKVRYMGNTPEAVEAFKAGALDWICTIEPYASALVNDVKGAVMLTDGIDMYGKGYTDCVLAARSSLIKDNPAGLKAVIKAMMQAQYDAETQTDAVLKELVGKYYKTSMENAKIAQGKQPAIVDARSQTSSSSTAPTASSRWATSRRSPAATHRLDDARRGHQGEPRPLRQAQVQVGGLMAVVTPPAFSEGSSAAGTSRPAAVARLFATMAGESIAARSAGRSCRSACSAASGSLCWRSAGRSQAAAAAAHLPRLDRRPGQVLQHRDALAGRQVDDRRPVGLRIGDDTIGATTMRVFVGLLIASVLGIGTGVLVRYYKLFDRLVLPTVTLLSPVSPIAWLPVAIFIFGIGNGPAIFMVVVALFFHMVLATITQIDGVSNNLINVARTMGASKRQIYGRVIVPAILPGMLAVLRMNLFAAWMVVLIAESTGVGYGMGQVIMLARNTFNPSLVFFTIAVIGVLGFTFDWLLRQAQRRILYWLPDQTEKLRAL
jgi:NitT/TauT family transport system permease protein